MGHFNKTHGLSQTRGYAIWQHVMERCYKHDNDNYRWYGGKGTYVCLRWRTSVAFFIEDMGQPPTKKHSIDRIDTLANYTCGQCEECKAAKQPANCRWATKDIQVRNCKNNRHFTHDGKTLILKDWARLIGMPYLALYLRIVRRKWTFEDAITIPINTEPGRHKHRRKSTD